MTIRTFLLLFTLASTACAVGGAAPADTAVSRPGRLVGTAPVVEDVISPPVTATGTLRAKDEIALSFKIGGVVERVFVDAAAAVRRGETLAALDVGEIDAAVARATSAVEKADRDAARARRLFAENVVTRVQLDDAETALKVAQADLDTARFNRRYAVIVAPADGTILERRVEPGELVSPGAPALVLASRDRGVVVRAGITDRDVVRLRPGDPGVVRFDAVPGRAFSGAVTQIGATAEPATGTFLVEVALGDAGGLPVGLVGRLEIRPRGGRTATVVPIEALVEADGSAATVFALAADGESVERRRVDVGSVTGGRVAITAGLDGVRAVVVDGAAYLNDGDRVTVSTSSGDARHVRGGGR